jgi:hypothetical protein
MHDWRLSPLVVITLPGSWAYREPQQGQISKARRRRRSFVRRGLSTVRQLLGRTPPMSREAVPQGDRRDLNPG